ncbi:MAG: response regulator [Desulfobacterales bacterium]
MDSFKDSKKQPGIEDHINISILLVDNSRRVQKLDTADPEKLPRPPQELIGMLPGEALGCKNAMDFPGRCGRTEACRSCAINKTIKSALENGDSPLRRKARFTRLCGNNLEEAKIYLSATPIDNNEKTALLCIEDLTGLEKTLYDIRQRKDRLRSLLMASPIGMGFLELKIENNKITDRIIRDVNERLCLMTGYSRGELIDKSIRMLYAEEGDYDYVTRKNYPQLHGNSMGTVETRWKTKDGQIRSISLTTAPLDPDDWSFGISFTATDITEKKKAREERQQLEQRLRHTQKMEAVGELSGGIAHEFNNLLQIINGYADLMTDDIDKTHPARASLDEIIAAGNRAAKLVRNLLAFSSRQVMQMMDIRINDLISKTINMLRGLLGENIEIDFIPGHNLGLVHTDPSQFEQVLVNLCVNARDAMPEGGTITIETENILINGQYCRTHDWAQPGRFVLISVSDTGAGMDAYTAARAFEPFFTTKPPEKSHGLGLATAYGIIRQHDGMLNVYSEPGQGSLFKIYLPVVERRASEVEVNLKGKILGGSETILIAEDDEMVCDLMQTVLNRAGYRTICTRDGQKAIDMFESSMEDIDLAVLDVVMPNKNGREVSDAIEKLKPETKVLFCSGYSTNAIHSNFVLHENTELLQKPFTADELLRKVRDLLDSDKKPSKA